MFNRVVLVDRKNTEIGTEDKLEAHKKGLLHRAFSIFIFNDKNEILLQQRSDTKYHSACLWSNTCCSHPYNDKTVSEYAKQRLVQEMGIKTNLKEIFSFIYRTSFRNGLVEYEYDHVFFGKYNYDPILNKQEAADFRWINFKQLQLDIEENPAKFTFWLKKIVQDYSLYFLNYENNNL
ncbi:MAG: isopentenyl-diphosphate delta-isomerase [Flavobacteriaceae bacterium]|nr:isopentenyl-diphosphate delta-isomerase [Flavobacteriaceae bacterium]